MPKLKPRKTLTPTERIVAQGSAKGLSEREIAKGLGIKGPSVHSHLAKSSVQDEIKRLQDKATTSECLTLSERRGILADKIRSGRLRDSDLSKMLELDAKLAGELAIKIESTVTQLGDDHRQRLGLIVAVALQDAQRIVASIDGTSVVRTSSVASLAPQQRALDDVIDVSPSDDGNSGPVDG